MYSYLRAVRTTTDGRSYRTGQIGTDRSRIRIVEKLISTVFRLELDLFSEGVALVSRLLFEPKVPGVLAENNFSPPRDH